LLVSFTVSNFRCIRDSQTLTLQSSSDDSHAATNCTATGVPKAPRINGAAVIFGPNGSGKSTLLAALVMMRDIVLGSNDESRQNLSEWHSPFTFDTPHANYTEFSVAVVLGDTHYRYWFSYNSTRVCREGLRVTRTGKPQRWFERRLNVVDSTETWAPFFVRFEGRRTEWRQQTGPHVLFLSVAGESSCQLKPLVDWFAQCSLFTAEPHFAMKVTSAFRYRIADPRFKQGLLAFLGEAGMRPVDFRIGGPVARGRESGIECLHRSALNVSNWMPLEDESDGLRRLIALFISISDASRGNGLLLADEFDLGLHPLVARHVLRTLCRQGASISGAQFVLASHGVTLMDVALLRRDQIWLTMLVDQSRSELMQISRFVNRPRKHELVGKQYIAGRYGSIPLLSPTAGTRQAYLGRRIGSV
jgi:uncharacterized protein